MARIVIKDINPKMGLPGGSIKITGKRFQPWKIEHSNLHFSNSIAWIEGVSESALITSVPPNSISGNIYIDVDGYQSNKFHFIVPETIISGLHLVDNPVVDSEGNIFATYSGNRGEMTPVSIYKVSKLGKKETYLTGITNPTSLVMGTNNTLYIGSRFDGKIYRTTKKGKYEIFSQGLGTAFGMAINSQNELFVGDRTGSIFKVDPSGRASFFTSIPQSYIAFHLGFDSKDNLYVSNPVHMGENFIYRISKGSEKSEIYYAGLSLFHGFVFDSKNNLYLAETKRNESRIIKIKHGKYVSTVLTGTNFIGLALDPKQNLIVATSTSLYLIEKGNY